MDVEGISNLQNLQSLSLNQNRLENLGSSLGVLGFLKDLSLADNYLNRLNHALLGCEKLQRLDIRGNRLSELLGLSSCTQLTFLDVSKNRLESLEVRFHFIL